MTTITFDVNFFSNSVDNPNESDKTNKLLSTSKWRGKVLIQNNIPSIMWSIFFYKCTNTIFLNYIIHCNVLNAIQFVNPNDRIDLEKIEYISYQKADEIDTNIFNY